MPGAIVDPHMSRAAPRGAGQPCFPSDGGRRKADVVQDRRSRPERGENDADTPSVAGHPRMMAQQRHSRVICVHQREERRHDAEEQMQRVSVGQR